MVQNSPSIKVHQSTAGVHDSFASCSLTKCVSHNVHVLNVECSRFDYNWFIINVDVVINKAFKIVKTTSYVSGQSKSNTCSGVNVILYPDTTVSWLPKNN